MTQSFTAAMARFFGKRGTLAEFNAELKALSPADKAFFAEQLRQNGIDCEEPK